MKFRIGRIAAGAAALASACVVSVVGGASADVPPGGINWDHTYRATGVVVYVEEHGDIVSVCDTAANGHAAEMDAGPYYGADYILRATNGKGSCKTGQASDGGRRNLPEGSTITVYFDGNNGRMDHKRTFLNDH